MGINNSKTFKNISLIWCYLRSIELVKIKDGHKDIGIKVVQIKASIL